MGHSHSKLLKPMYYDCHELGHTWDKSCTRSTVEVGLTCFYESLKIYSSVYAVSALFRGKKISREMLKSLVGNILQSSVFLSYNTFGFVWAFCSVRKLLGFSNFYLLAFVPSLICNFLAILVERPSRRSLLAVYCGNVATESAITSLKASGLLPDVKHGEAISFSVVSSILMFLYRKLKLDSEKRKKEVRHEEDLKLQPDKSAKDISPGQDFIFTIIRMLIGDAEKTVIVTNPSPKLKSRPTESFLSYWSRLLFHYWGRTFKAIKQIMTNQSSSICPHENEKSCLSYIFKGFLSPFLVGTSCQILLSILKRLRGRGKLNIFQKGTFTLGLFMGSFGGIYKLSSCLIRSVIGHDSSLVALPSGFLAGMSMILYPSKTIATYTWWKTAEILIRLGNSHKIIPTVPLFVEMVYAVATAVLFHLSIVEPQSLKPSYFAFMNRITGDRVNEINRFLVDFEYGSRASEITPTPPVFNLNECSSRFQQVWPKILQKLDKN